jgi:hypothetical protein
MVDNTTLEAAIHSLADEVKKLREAKPSKSLGDYFATWSPIVALAVFVLTALGVNDRVGRLELRVEQGFEKLSDQVHTLDTRLAVDEVRPNSPSAGASSAKR